MKGLLLKDLNMLKGYGKQYGIVFAIMSVWAISMKSISFVSMYSILLGGMLVLSTMTLDEAVNFNRWALTTPVGVKGLIGAKYVLLICTVSAGCGIGLLLNVTLGAFLGGVQRDAVETIPVVAALFFIAYSITLPVSFKFGVEKSRYIYVVILSLVAVVVFGLAKILDGLGVLEKIDGSDTACLVALCGMLAVSVLVLVISYRVSIQVVRNKEW